MYFSGLLVIAETAQRSYQEKVRILEELLTLPVVDRLDRICGSRAVSALKLYDVFLGEMAKEDVRAQLDQTSEINRENEPFRKLKDLGHHFSWKLMSLLRETYDSSHPIHRVIVL